MKHLFIIITLLAGKSFSQNWQETNIASNVNGQRYDDVFFLNDSIGWAANGFYSAVYKTINGGQTWIEQLNGDDLLGNYYFRNIEFLNTNIGFLGTLNGSFFKTEDGGNTWNTVSNISPNPNAICGLDAVGSSTIYGCGSYFSPAVIIKSTDSGTTWQSIDMSSYANSLVEVLFVDENLGYAGGKNDIGACLLKTTDGGISWNTIFNSNTVGEYVWKVQFVSNNPNIIYGSLSSVANSLGKIIKSNDGGVTWTSFDAPETNVQAIGFINETRGWMGGHATGFYETNDGGESWTNINVGSNLNRIVILNDNLAYGCGTSIYKFTDEFLGNDTKEQQENFLNPIINNNPVEKELSLSMNMYTSDNLIISIYNINGKFIKYLKRQVSFDQNTRIKYLFNVSELQSGFYLLNLHNNLGQTTLKFLKK
ncbi:T9SS type A sorting domain-containing protein [Flavobacteriaceae bacterium]|jgi:photosystem II stability/assembly factor-like uncharacterized protein|nr:T9SS type A sorting domain-containing protein [Flavobacteriaceae bacterium]